MITINGKGLTYSGGIYHGTNRLTLDNGVFLKDDRCKWLCLKCDEARLEIDDILDDIEGKEE